MNQLAAAAVLLLSAGAVSAQVAVPIEAAAPPIGSAYAAGGVSPAAEDSVSFRISAGLGPVLQFFPGRMPRPGGNSYRAAAADPSVVPAVTPAAQALRLAILGPPGAGKGTYGRRIAREYGVVHVSAGDLLRDYATTHPEVAETMRRGLLVDAKVVLDLVRERLSREDVRERGFLLDGFPRRLEEAKALEEWLGPERRLDAVIHLDAPEAELRRRISSRGRFDDTPAVFRDRMEVYRRDTLPVLEHFAEAARVLAPDVSSSDLEVDWERVRDALRSVCEEARRAGR